jgi:hypothetical protein
MKIKKQTSKEKWKAKKSKQKNIYKDGSENIMRKIPWEKKKK